MAHHFFSEGLSEKANARFKRPCSFAGHPSWKLWAQSYQWLDHTGNLREGDTIAFVERLSRSPYPSLVVCTIAVIDGEFCQLALVAHDQAERLEGGGLITRKIEWLEAQPVKRWPRQPRPFERDAPQVPHNGGGLHR